MAAKTLTIKASEIILISDIHFGVHSNSMEWQDNMRDYFYNFFIPLVKRHPNAAVVSLGDVYDDRKSIDIDVNNLTIDVFEDLSQICQVYIINGNHDLSKKTNKGNTSLRSLSNIPNVTIIKEPTLLKLSDNGTVTNKFAAIPYLGSYEEENSWLVKLNGKADFAFMHTDISRMRFDNGMLIQGAVDSDKFGGCLISGHIHKRQAEGKVLYVGSPYHTKASDIGNEKGIYILKSGSSTIEDLEFVENNYSPIYKKIEAKRFSSMSIEEAKAEISNNYVYIVMYDDDVATYKGTKKIDLFDKLNKCNPRTGSGFRQIKSKVQKTDTNEIVVEREKTTQELINDCIAEKCLEEKTTQRLVNISNEYFRLAENEDLD